MIPLKRTKVLRAQAKSIEFSTILGQRAYFSVNKSLRNTIKSTLTQSTFPVTK